MQFLMVGERHVDPQTTKWVYEKEFYRQGFIYKDEHAFLFGVNEVCYIAEDDYQNEEKHYTRKDIVRICDGNVNLAIKNNIPKVYHEYVKYCATFSANKEDLLGKVQIIHSFNPVTQRVHYIANMFAQVNYGGNKRNTNYDALFSCLQCVHEFSKRHNDISIALPYKIGCVREKGDWHGIVCPMICDIFEKDDRKVYLYEL